MPEIEFTPSQKTIIVEPGGLLLDALRSANIELDAQCGGKGVCGKCRVRIMKGSVVFDARVSAGTMDAQDVEKGYVLACSTKVGVDDLVVFVPEQNCGSDRYQDPECQEDQQGYRQEHVLLPGNLEYDPLVRAIHLIIPEAKPEDGLSDLDRVRSAILDYTKCDDVEFPLSVVRTLADTVREENGSVTVTLFSYPETSKGSGEIDRVLRVAAGSLQEPLYGIAVDVGTTSISVRLVELRSGRIAATAGDYNDQIPCGQDVISRIIYSGGQGRLKELRSRVLGTVNRLIGICIEIASDQDPVEINHGDIVCAVIS